MEMKKKSRFILENLARLTFVIIVVLGAFYAGAYSGVNYAESAQSSKVTILNNCNKAPLELHEERSVSINLPAINKDGLGVAARLDVSAIPGSGMVLVNLNRVLSREETQQSVRTAALVASDITGIDLSAHDLIYDIYANATVLEGPSAGAAMTLATIAVLEGKEINPALMITGTINHDGTIGPAGKVREKAHAAKDAGSTAFYVPVGSATEVNYTESEFCYDWGTYEYCQPELKSETIDLETEVGIDIIESPTIKDIMNDFLV